MEPQQPSIKAIKDEAKPHVMGYTGNSSLDSDDDSVNVHESLLRKEDLLDKEKKPNDQRKTTAFRCHYFTLFVNAIATTITYSSLWAYLKTLDIETTTWYLGLVHAAFNGGELCFIVLFGIWVQYRQAIEPLTFSLVALIIGSTTYALSSTFGYYGKFSVLIARMIMGCATGNDVIVTVLLCEQTTIGERTSIIVHCTVAQAIGFIIGPVVQSCFVPIGKVGVYFKALYLHINMYTMAGIFCIFIGLVNLVIVWMYGRVEFKAIELDSDAENHNANENKKGKPDECEDEESQLPDVIAVITILTLFYFVRHILVFIEVMFAPMAMDFYALSNKDTLIYISLMLSLIGVGSIFTFVAIDKLASRIGDQALLLISALFGFLGFAVLWPGSSIYPQLAHFYTLPMNTTGGTENLKKVTLGCSPFHSWCKTTPIITIPQVAISVVFLLISFPISYTVLPSLYTKVLKPGRQGIMMSLLNLSGNFSRIAGPTMFTSIYAYYGPKVLILVMDIGLFISLLLSVTFYRRLIPYKEYRSGMN